MVKAEWGTKRTCPKCATRFYDLGKDDPVVCINCNTAVSLSLSALPCTLSRMSVAPLKRVRPA